MLISKVFSFFFVCLLAVCGNFISQKENISSQINSAEQNQQLKSADQNQQKANTELTVKMERISWSGRLMYKVEIQPEGKVIFEGTEYTKTKGKAESNLEKEKIEQLLTEITTSDFFSFDSAYVYPYKNCPLMMSDNDFAKIYVKLNEKEKSITHDLGCLDMSMAELKQDVNRKARIFPQKLYKLENKIDEIVETKRWIGEQK